jgi:hypothetical protein
MATRRTPLASKAILIAVVLLVALGGYYFINSQGENAPTLEGTWTVRNSVVLSDLKRYRDDRHEFRIQVTQQGDQLSGSGEQTKYNGKPARNKYPIWFTKATVAGDRVMIHYAMKGGRETVGVFELTITSPSRLEGTFTSTAANTSGTTVVEIAPR